MPDATSPDRTNSLRRALDAALTFGHRTRGYNLTFFDFGALGRLVTTRPVPLEASRSVTPSKILQLVRILCRQGNREAIAVTGVNPGEHPSV